MKEPTSPTAPLAAFPPQPEEYRSRAPEFYGFVAWSSTYLLFVLFILWSFLPDEWIVWSGVTWYPNRYFLLVLLSGFYLRSVRPNTGNGRCCFRRGRWSSCSSPTLLTSLWLCLQPRPSRTSPPSPVCPIHLFPPPSLYLHLFVQPARPDSKGRLLDPATFDFADEGVATEMYDIPITSVNHALYDRG